MTIATPKQPFSRQPNGWAPTDMSHVQPGGWIEVQVGEEYVAGWRNVVFGYVLGFASGEEVFMLVADEVQDPAVTGIPNHAVVRVALADIQKSEHSPVQQAWELRCELDEVERNILSANKDEFNRRYPKYCDDALEQANKHPVGANAHEFDRWRAEFKQWLAGWQQARHEFVELLIAEGRA